MMGTLYGLGVGPGDPELLTVKAARLIRECAVVAVPDSGTGEQVALDIARVYIGDKPVLRCPFPMTRDEEALRTAREQSADQICRELEGGNSVAFLTLGDPTVYSTYIYLHRLVMERGFPAEIVPGVPSFCAAAAALNRPLCEAGQPLHIIPASYPGAEEALALDGVKVLMKSGKSLDLMLRLLEERGLLENSALAERVGMPQERLIPDLKSLDMGRESPGYLSLVIVGEKSNAD